MARIPLEDNYTDVINKAQRGLKIDDADLAARAEVSLEDLAAVKAGKPIDAVIRRVARHLRLHPELLEDLAHKRWYPTAPSYPHGFAMFNTVYGDMTVNSYLVWDSKTRLAAVFDTGASCRDLLDTISAEGLRVKYIFLTHTHEDHIADLARLADGCPGAEVWSSESEPVAHPGAKFFKENAYFHIGGVAIKTLLVSGHSPGMTTYFITGLSWPLAVCGDSVFASSMAGSADRYKEQFDNSRLKVLTLPRDTVLAPGHGPLTTVGQEKKHNPFFVR